MLLLPDRDDNNSPAGRGRRHLKVRVGSPASAASAQPPPLINFLPRDQSADEEAEEGGTRICPLRDRCSRDGQWGDDSTQRGDRDDEDDGRGRAWSSPRNDEGLRLPLLLEAPAFKSDLAISWRPCRARLKAVHEAKDKQNNFRGVRKVAVEHGVEREQRPNGETERTERRRVRVRFGASVAARCLTLVTLAMPLLLPGAEGVGVAHRSLLNTGNPDAKRLYDDLLSNYNR